MLARQSTGYQGESLAIQELSQRGYVVIERNYRSGRWGEIDVICLEAGDLVFVEVKTRIGQSYGLPIEAVSYGKQQRLRRAAEYYKLTHPHTPASLRFDVVSVSQPNKHRVPIVEIYRNIGHN